MTEIVSWAIEKDKRIRQFVEVRKDREWHFTSVLNRLQIK
jgi:hypothetical protein